MRDEEWTKSKQKTKKKDDEKEEQEEDQEVKGSKLVKGIVCGDAVWSALVIAEQVRQAAALRCSGEIELESFHAICRSHQGSACGQ